MSPTLYIDEFWISPYAFSAYVALLEKDVPFSIETVALQHGSAKKLPFLAQSVTGRVPALEHDRFWLAESSAIVEYIDETFPGAPLLPRDLRERARARQIMAWIRSDLDAIRAERATHTMFYERATTPLSKAGERQRDHLIHVASTLVDDAAAKNARLFATWSVADADLAFMLHRLIYNGHTLPPHVRAYADAQWLRASIQNWVQHPRPPYVHY